MGAAVDAPDATSLAAAVREGRTDPVELVDAALTRLEQCDDDVRAFVHVDADAARAEAALRRREPARGPLHGVPVAVKDLYDVAGQVTTAGSRVPAPPPAARDATAVARLRAAGAVVVGRTRTHEFAWGITTWHPDLGGTRNPHDLGRTAGGSSGGSAAAVAAGVVPLGLGTDTGCSLRLPATWCGLVAHKPTWGTVPLDGVVPLAPSLDCGGALVRSVRDAVLAHEVLSGTSLALPPHRPLVVGRLAAPDVAPEVGGAVDSVVEALGPRDVVDVVLDAGDDPVEVYAAVQGAEALDVHRARGWWPQHRGSYGADVRGRLEAAEALPPARVERAAAARQRLRQHVQGVFATVDLLVMPVAGCAPSRTDGPDSSPSGGRLRDAVLPFTVPVNLCGLPACAVPAGTAGGLPTGVQLVGPPGGDARVLSAAAAAEAARAS